MTIGIVGIQSKGEEISDKKLQRRIEKWQDIQIEEELMAVQGREEAVYRDSITGQALRPDLVREARSEELRYFAMKGVWRKRPRKEAVIRSGKAPITVKWVDVNKGDDLTPTLPL